MQQSPPNPDTVGRGLAIPETITTPRLIGRRLAYPDLPDLVAMGRDVKVMATLGGVRSEAETRRNLETAVDHWHTHGFGCFARCTTTRLSEEPVCAT